MTALCIDCHGVHNITRVDDPTSPVLKANLVKTCQKCHPGAPETFPAAWLSHYEPSWQKAPLVYSVKVFYTVFIPFIIGGLVLQILLHLWRAGGEPMSEYLRPIHARGSGPSTCSVMSIFTLLALTGFPQKFYDASWAHGVVTLFGGIERMRFVHRMCGHRSSRCSRSRTSCS